MSDVTEKRPLTAAMFWPDVIEELVLVPDDESRMTLWIGAVRSCLVANGFPASVVDDSLGADQGQGQKFMNFVRERFVQVSDDDMDEE